MIDVETMQRKNKGEIQRRWKRWLEGEVELDSDGPEGGGFKLRVIDTARNRLIYVVRNSESTSRGSVMPGLALFHRIRQFSIQKGQTVAGAGSILYEISNKVRTAGLE